MWLIYVDRDSHVQVPTWLNPHLSSAEECTKGVCKDSEKIAPEPPVTERKHQHPETIAMLSNGITYWPSIFIAELKHIVELQAIMSET